MLGLNTTLPDHKGALLEEKESLTALEILEWNCSRRAPVEQLLLISPNLVEMETFFATPKEIEKKNQSYFNGGTFW